MNKIDKKKRTLIFKKKNTKKLRSYFVQTRKMKNCGISSINLNANFTHSHRDFAALDESPTNVGLVEKNKHAENRISKESITFCFELVDISYIAQII